MELPQPPTDNLYKFMALSGIILVAISLFPFLHAHKLRQQIIHWEGDASILHAQVDWAITDMNELRSDSKGLTQRIVKLTERTFEGDFAMETGESKSDIGEEIAEDAYDAIDENLELEDRNAEIRDVTKKQTIALLQLETRNRELKYLETVLGREVFAARCVFGCGFALACVGFWLWYKKLQVFQDKVIQRKAEGKQDE